MNKNSHRYIYIIMGFFFVNTLVSPVFAKDDYKIGCIFPLSGTYEKIGKRHKQTLTRLGKPIG